MKIIKKIMAFAFAICLCLGGMVALTGCGSDDGKIDVLCTIFPEYDWAKNIIGENDENINLSLLIDDGTDMHSFNPSVSDIAAMQSCDVFVYVGGESDEKYESILEGRVNKDMKIIKLMDIIENKIGEDELVVVGEEGGHVHTNHEGEHEEGEEEYDEHVWLSLENAKTVVNYIAKELGKLDADNKDAFIENANSYIEKIDALDAEYVEATENATNNMLIFADRFPFVYLTTDYSISYVAAYKGCDANVGVTQDKVAGLIEEIEEHDAKYIMVIDGSDKQLAETVKNGSTGNQEILTLDSMQSTKMNEIEKGKTYLSVMESNLEVLKVALN